MAVQRIIPCANRSTRAPLQPRLCAAVELSLRLPRVMPIWNTMAAIPGHGCDEVVVIGCCRDVRRTRSGGQPPCLKSCAGTVHRMLPRLTGSIILPLNTTQYTLELHNYLDQCCLVFPSTK
ncbi:hypothetical protein B0H12DRAFT_853571 [Mycena haematopus]|nr:hypothetical protein B0H12DRAFT_853571 [Mycena haematopus]